MHIRIFTHIRKYERSVKAALNFAYVNAANKTLIFLKKNEQILKVTKIFPSSNWINTVD